MLESGLTGAKLEAPVRARRGLAFSPPIISGLAGIADAVIIAGVGMAFYLGYVGWNPQNVTLYLVSLASNVVLTVGFFRFAGLYDFESILSPAGRMGKIAAIFLAVFMIMVAVAFGLKISAEFSRVWFFSSLIAETLLTCMFRLGLGSLLNSRAGAGAIARRIAVVGCTEQGTRFIEELKRRNTPWNEIVGVFSDRKDEGRTASEVAGVPVLGDLDDLVEFMRRERIDDIVIALPWTATKRLMKIIGRLRELPVHVRLGTDMIGYEFLHRAYSSLAGIPLLDVVPKPLADWKIVLKAVEDKLLATLALILFAPLMALIALAVKLESKGPLLFRQKRFGFNNEEFEVFKFRTMYTDRPPEEGVPQAKRDDQRETKLGEFLRRWSLDELPQLMNVLRGDMSLVGPRPHAVEHNEKYSSLIRGYFARHRVKPGITGWAQVNGLRGETDILDKMKARVEYDVYYMENWSLLFDLRILAMTPYALLTNRNVY